ncbi:CAP domain-containing protein [Jeotgalibacillus soli]|uniref:SCP domain-containing protein n=1 Tax=Jeotgalibacillus soli TaxID=889306 RepID=A0A0C2VM30_9BACL|nr:CAP domain-containing protein [Jeotgalibacillus soli]KIL45048.1 hypothetical protein KP78_25920 [Jeotgalibacillus soli]
MNVKSFVISGALAASLLLAPTATQASSGAVNVNQDLNSFKIEQAVKSAAQQQRLPKDCNTNWGMKTPAPQANQAVKQPAAPAKQQPATKQSTATKAAQPVQAVKQPASQAQEKQAGNQQSTQKSAPAAENQKPANQSAHNKAVSAFEQKVVDLTNAERAKQGLKPLTLDVSLSKVAKDKSLDMKQKNYFSHTSPTYGSPFDMMKSYGISYKTAGENIAMGQRSPEEVVKAWMNSEGHRKNIMSSSFTHIGVGHVEQGNYWTQMFIGK